MSNNRLIHEDSLGIGQHLSKMTLGEHNMLIYADVNSLREIYCSHSRKSLQSRNNAVIILYHYETKGSIRNALKEFDIEVDRYEADRSLIITDANEIIFKPTLDSFMQYLKALEELAIKYGKNGIDVIVDMGSFRHLGKEQELIECENRFNITSGDSKSSILCCYHDKDLKSFDATRIEEIHKSHLKNYIIKEQE
ncbi:MAG: MEDS domain-containing protein [Thermoproteota archaeon]|nr:MEDS domain-containing protein [Thermoproteota archaeon]